MGILWINLHPNTSPIYLSSPGYWCYWPDCVLPYILTACHAWPMTQPLHITMIMHELLKYAQKICTLTVPMSLMRLRYDHREHGWRGHLYGMNGTWKNYPTRCTLLDAGFMIILRMAGGFVLIWACSAVLTEPKTAIFQISQLYNKTFESRIRKNLKVASSF